MQPVVVESVGWFIGFSKDSKHVIIASNKVVDEPQIGLVMSIIKQDVVKVQVL